MRNLKILPPLFFAFLVGSMLLVGCAAPAAPAPAEEAAAAEIACSVLGLVGSDETSGDDFSSIVSDFVSFAVQELGGEECIRTDIEDGYPEGVNQNVLTFYSGHGDPEDWTGSPLDSITSSLGNSGDNLRYLVHSACETFAHGPESCSDPDAKKYGCPGKWHWDVDGDGFVDEDSASMRSVFARWGDALGGDLRMACGASTELSPQNAYAIQTHYNGYNGEQGKYVADSIIAGLVASDAVALCITRGGGAFSESPLVRDDRFTSEANLFPEDFYHIQYSKPFSDPYKPVRQFVDADNVVPGAASLPSCLPVLHVDEGAQVLYVTGEQNFEDFDVASSEQSALDSAPQQAAIDNAIDAIFDQLPNETGEEWIEPYVVPVGEGGNTSEEVPFAYGIHMMLASAPIEVGTPGAVAPARDALDITQKNVIVTFKRRIGLADLWVSLGEDGRLEEEQLQYTDALIRSLDQLITFYDEGALESGSNYIESLEQLIERIDEQGLAPVEYDPSENADRRIPLINVLGSGGRIELQLNNDGSVINAMKSWREVQGVLRMERVLQPGEAYTKAQNHTVMPEAYVLDSWSWGYSEWSGRASQSEMKIWYVFNFVPNVGDGYTAQEYPPRRVWIEGQIGESCAVE